MTSQEPGSSRAVESGELTRLAYGIVDECRRDGRAVRTLSTVTDAIVVRALVAAQARRSSVVVEVSRHDRRIDVVLIGGV